MNTSKNRQASIGVFDSGVGGLTVVSEIMTQLPDESIVYFGDTARVPYGNKSRETVTRYSEQIIRFLLTQNVKAIVVACNTASSFALSTVTEEFDIPILGVVEPGARTAISATRSGKIGVIGTEGTVSSEVYTRAILEKAPGLTVSGKACPLFVPLVEEGWVRDSITREVATRYLSPLMDQDIDTLILGCTHYPLLKPLIGELMGPSVALVNPAFETAKDLKQLQEREDLLRDGRSSGEQYRFFVSDSAKRFEAFADRILTCRVTGTKAIPIEDF